MRPPSRIRVGYRNYRVETKTYAEYEEDGDLGNCDREQGVITLCNEGLPPEVVLDTLIHEVMHACWIAAGLHEIVEDKDSTEEIVVLTMASNLTQVFIDNPEFLRWVSKMSTKSRKLLEDK